MVKRQLTEEEKDLCTKSIGRLIKQKEWLGAQNEYNTLQIEKLLKMNFERQLDKFKDELAKNKADIEEHTQAIDILYKQMREGVDSKEQKEEAANE